MDTTPPPSSFFLRQLGRWTFHCLLNAAPAFCIAIACLPEGKQPATIAAMLWGILTLIIGFSLLTSLPGPMRDGKHVFPRALSIGLKIRNFSLVLGVPLMAVDLGGVVIAPDFILGILAMNLIPGPENFATIYLTTLLVGLGLAFLILTISFLAAFVLLIKDRRNAFLIPDSRHAGGI